MHCRSLIGRFILIKIRQYGHLPDVYFSLASHCFQTNNFTPADPLARDQVICLSVRAEADRVVEYFSIRLLYQYEQSLWLMCPAP